MENIQIDINALQASRDINFEPISARYFTVVAIRAAIFFLIAATPIVIFNYNVASKAIEYIYSLGALIILLSLYLIIVKQTFKYRGIAVREHDVVFRSGFINISETLVPYKRVQHVKLRRGVFEKMFGLSQLLVFTAAGGAHNLSISGLQAEKAEKIKSYIIEQFDGPPASTTAVEKENDAIYGA